MWAATIVGAIAISAAPASVCIASTVTLQLTGVGNGTNYGGVYDSPYDISINGSSAMLLSCDDFATEIGVGSMWQAMTESASNVDNGVKFTRVA